MGLSIERQGKGCSYEGEGIQAGGREESHRIWIYGATYQEVVRMTILGNPVLRACDFPHARKSGGAADVRIRARRSSLAKA